MSFEIKTGVEIPARPGFSRETKYPWLNMYQGDCFDVPYLDAQQQKSLQASMHNSAKLKKVKITMRSMPGAGSTGTIRVWRLCGNKRPENTHLSVVA